MIGWFGIDYSAVLGDVLKVSGMGVVGMRDWRHIAVHAEQSDNTVGAWKLFPLTPEYDDTLHAGYVKALNSCLKHKNIRNIALTGDYGTGKSSILFKVAHDHRRKVVQVSLLTLNAEDKHMEAEASVRDQAMTPTNRIQQEIVKQLLYSADVKDMPRSRFKRIGKPSRFRELVAAVYIGLFILGTLIVTGWFSTLKDSLLGIVHADTGTAVNLVGGFLIIVGLSFGVIELLQGRVHLHQLSAGPATITLDKDSVSFFDQYLDEMVYFFDRSHRDIVIFEDLDRFENSYIFETLRALNLLLNSARKRRRKPIRFIYAVKDSVFDQTVSSQQKSTTKVDEKSTEKKQDIHDQAVLESDRANRTKFFDIIIPVVPFISHSTASSLIITLLNSTGLRVSPWIMDVAGRYVTDMRLLKNICNEYIIFHDRLNAGDGVDMDYDDDQIFAMMLYKNTCLKQFELLKTGKSDLDNLYKDYRRLTAENITALQTATRTLKQEETALSFMDARSKEYGKSLRSFLEQGIKSFYDTTSDYTVRCRNLDFTPAELDDQSFWETLVEAPEQEAITLKALDRSRTYRTSSFTKTNISQVVGINLDADAWNNEKLRPLADKVQKNKESIDLLRAASMKTLFKHANFTLPANLVEERDTSSSETHTDRESFEDIAKRHLGKGLIFELVRRGAITRDYFFYAQTFYGNRVSAAAANFIRHQVEPNEMDIQISLSNKAVQDVLRESAGGDLGERAYYNVSILDYILGPDYEPPKSGLAEDVPQTDRLIMALANLGPDERNFLQAYLELGKDSAKDVLVVKMLKYNPGILAYLISGVDLVDENRKHWVNLVLRHVSSTEEYALDEDARAYLSARLDEFEVLHSENVRQDTVVAVTTILEAAGAMATRLDQFSTPFINEFISHFMYDINRPNLLIVTGQTNISLDTVNTLDAKEVYPYILSRIDTYLSVLSDEDHSVAASDSFVRVLNDVATQEACSGETIDGIIGRSCDDCIINDLTSVEVNTWHSLVKHSRIALTYANVSAYTNDSELIDEDMGRMLANGHTIRDVPVSEETEPSRESLAVKILNSASTIPQVDPRIQHAVSLNLSEYLDVSLLLLQQDGFAAAMIKDDLIADDKTTFARILKVGWHTMEPAIAASDEFSTFMTSDMIPSDKVSQLISSAIIPGNVKQQIIENIADYTEECDAPSMQSVMNYALEKHHAFDFDDFVYLIKRHVDDEQIINALTISYEDLDQTEIHTVLNNLPGDYPKLTSPGRDRPKLVNTASNIKLLQQLKEANDVVTSFTPRGDRIVVNKRHR
ncbi:P-loop NTPase fold protein [Bifidobacterium psychraerophilum]|uniref:YobI family P-loop NTPase n=1 Tax=Bifidobacterium psychraerophilum TaxID=218140 RepID=UPI0039ECB9F0